MCFDELHAAIFVERRADTAAGTRLGVSSNVRLDIGCWTARLLHDCLKFRGIMCRLCGEVSTREVIKCSFDKMLCLIVMPV